VILLHQSASNDAGFDHHLAPFGKKVAAGERRIMSGPAPVKEVLQDPGNVTNLLLD
jgi:hypothetical protein